MPHLESLAVLSAAAFFVGTLLLFDALVGTAAFSERTLSLFDTLVEQVLPFEFILTLKKKVKYLSLSL